MVVVRLVLLPVLLPSSRLLAIGIHGGDLAVASMMVAVMVLRVLEMVAAVVPPSSTEATATTATSTGVGGDPTGGVGGAQNGPAVGAGAGAPTGDGWVAGDVTEKDYDDAILVKSGCAMTDPSTGRSDTRWLGLFALGLGMIVGRRRPR